MKSIQEITDQLCNLQKEYNQLSRDYVLACKENLKLTKQINEKNSKPTKFVNIEAFVKNLKQENYTIEQWQQIVDELCRNGVGRGCFQDYYLLSLVMDWLEIFKTIF